MNYGSSAPAIAAFRERSEKIATTMEKVTFYTFWCPECDTSKPVKGRVSRGYKAGYRCACCDEERKAKTPPASLTQHVLFGHPFHAPGTTHQHIMDKVPANPIKEARKTQHKSKKVATERSMFRVLNAMAKGAKSTEKIRELSGMDYKSIRMSLAELIKLNKVSKRRIGVAFVYTVIAA